MGLSAPTPRHSVSHTQWTNGSPTGQMDDDEEDKYAKHAKVPSPRTPPEMPNGSRWGTRRASTTNGWGSRSPSRVHPTLSGKGAGRGRAEEAVPHPRAPRRADGPVGLRASHSSRRHRRSQGVHPRLPLQHRAAAPLPPIHPRAAGPRGRRPDRGPPPPPTSPTSRARYPSAANRKSASCLCAITTSTRSARRTVANKQAYADRHGYDVIVDSEIIDESRPTSWSKLLAMRKYLPYYDYLFYVDVDTIVANVDVKLEDIVGLRVRPDLGRGQERAELRGVAHTQHPVESVVPGRDVGAGAAGGAEYARACSTTNKGPCTTCTSRGCGAGR